MPKINTPADFELTLEENALSSLKHGVKHYLEYIEKENKEDLKFAIIHVFHAIELYLKARLARESPLLIYSTPDKRIGKDSHTVGFGATLARLNDIGAAIDRQDEDCLKSLKKKRNCMEHYKILDTIKDLENYLAKAYKFLSGSPILYLSHKQTSPDLCDDCQAQADLHLI